MLRTTMMLEKLAENLLLVALALKKSAANPNGLQAAAILARADLLAKEEALATAMLATAVPF